MKKLILALFTFLPILSNAQTIFEHACRGNINVLDSLLQTTDVNTESKNKSGLLHFATYCNQKEVFDFLINKGINIDTKNIYGDTPLFYALQRRSTAMVEKLLEKKADVNQINEDGFTPIYYAIRADDEESLDLLLNAKADVNLGTNALHLATLNNNLNIVKRLVHKDIKVDEVNGYGNTPLAIAMREGHVEMAEFLIIKGADRKKVVHYDLKGEYLGQTKPDTIPVLFAKNIVSTENFVHSPTFSINDDELYYTVESRRYHGGTIFVSRQVDGICTTPQPTNIDGDYREIDPFISPDNSTMFYCSNRPLNEGDSTRKNSDIWMVKRDQNTWGKPIHLGEDINDPDYDDWFPTLSNNGTLFFSTGPNRSSNIVYTKLKNGQYQAPKKLGPKVNSPQRDYDPLIAPDERFVIFSSNRPVGFGSVDLYISFKDETGNWTEAQNMGEVINTSTIEFAPRLSRDGKYLFFNRGPGIYWVSTEVIEKLKP
ncbi:MAG: ankyrin repeat domain-containing protein [Bacteroidota bacterium]